MVDLPQKIFTRADLNLLLLPDTDRPLSINTIGKKVKVQKGNNLQKVGSIRPLAITHITRR